MQNLKPKNNTTAWPSISAIIPVYNEEKRLPDCLKSLRQQDYPGKIEIVVVDDDSTDRTVEIAQQYKCKILENGTHNIERGKSIGVQNSSSDFVLLLDADNRLSRKDWLTNAISAYQENGDRIIGVQTWKYTYKRKHTLADRYADLFGMSDPAVMYLKRQDRMKWTDQVWKNSGDVIKDASSYIVVKFNRYNLPTVGSQGFLIERKNVVSSNYRPYLFHMDIVLQMILQNKNLIVFTKDSVEHLHAEKISDILKKLRRNISLYFTQTKERQYRYDITTAKKMYLALVLGTFIVPLIDSVIGFIKFPEVAWLLHPYISFRVFLMYLWYTIKSGREKG